MSPKFKDLLWTLLRFCIISFIALLVQRFSTFILAFDDFDAFFICEALVVVFTFFIVLSIWTAARYPYRNEYLSEINDLIKDGIPFDFADCYKKSLKETFKKHLWKWLVFSIVPTVTCSYAWLSGYLPSMYTLPGNSVDPIITIGIAFFRASHAFFDIFNRMHLMAVPFGLFLGSIVFIFGFALIITSAKKRIYLRANYRHNLR